MKVFMQQLHNYIYKHSVNTGYLYMYLFPEADIYIFRGKYRQISERENWAHIGTIRISIKDSRKYHQVWLRYKATKDVHLHPIVFPFEQPNYHTHLIQIAINWKAARKRLNKSFHLEKCLHQQPLWTWLFTDKRKTKNSQEEGWIFTLT